MTLPNDKKELAGALARIEQSPESPETIAILDKAYRSPRAHVIGITGPPGVGKSTLIGALIGEWRQTNRSVGVIAVDPSSRVTGGALLGDRTRIKTDPSDDGVFIRSMAARDRLGGVSALTYPAMILMRALFDVIVVETVGVGQSETEIADLADTVVYCLQPGSGDSLQYMKAGIAEIPDIVLVTKADIGAAATRTQADARSAFAETYSGRDQSRILVLTVAASRGQGLKELLAAFDDHWKWLMEDSHLSRRRTAHAKTWLTKAVLERFGREGGKHQEDLESRFQSPFAALLELEKRMG